MNKALPGLLLLGAVSAAQALDVVQITAAPGGDQTVHQISVRFDRPVVALGQTALTPEQSPVTIAPDPGCQWHWIDPQTLRCSLMGTAVLRPATAYQISVEAGLVAEDGSVLAARVTKTVVTERPQLRGFNVVDWRSPLEPVLEVNLNQPVTAASLRAHLQLNGPVEVAAVADDATTPFYTTQGEARRRWQIWPRTPLSVGHDHPLQLKAGLQSALGAVPGREQTLQSVRAFAPLRWVGVRCELDGKTRDFAVKTTAQCAPLERVSLLFNNPVSALQLRDHLRISPPPPLPESADFDPWANAEKRLPLFGLWRGNRVHAVALPFTLKAETAYTLTLDAAMQDRLGQKLNDDARAQLVTRARAPRLVLDHDNAVLESGIASEVPVVVTNLSALEARFSRLTAAGLQTDQTLDIPVDPVRNLAFAMPLDVRGMVGARAGVVRGTVASHPADASARAFFAQVTPWQVMVKYAHDNTLVWVTRLDDGDPVMGAEVSIQQGMAGAPRARAVTDEQGLARLDGSAKIDPDLALRWKAGDAALAVRVQRGDDIALLPLDYDFSVDPWRTTREDIWSDARPRWGHLRAWGLSAQGVYRPGDTVQYKIYVRDDADRKLTLPPLARYHLQVTDAQAEPVHTRSDIRLNRFGALDGEFVLPRTAAVGRYDFVLTLDAGNGQTVELRPLNLLVADFVPAPFRVSSELRSSTVTPDQKVPLQISATLHGGGAFAGARLRAFARLQAQPLQTDLPMLAGFSFDSHAGNRDEVVLMNQAARLDAQGQWSGPLSVAESTIYHGRVIIEGSVEDDRGRSIAASSSKPYFGRDRFIGLRLDDWLLTQGQASTVQTVIIDDAGQPQAGIPFRVTVERKITQGARVKGAGNAYLTRYTHQWQPLASCQGRSQARPVDCRFVPDAAGEYRITAMVRDSHNRLHLSERSITARGSNTVLWASDPTVGLDLYAEQASWRVGQTARYVVKNPYPGARALITVERYGVLYQRVQTLEGSAAVIEIPVEPDFVPGAYVSVSLLSPRVAPAPEQGLDLGKPAFRMGYATLRIDEPWRAIKVAVTPAQSTLKPGEKARVGLSATARNPTQMPIEFAVAVLDEAVFDLLQDGERQFDPMRGLNALDPLDVHNYSLLMRLLGQQGFEKKGANPGGDGGAGLALRSLDRFVAYWNPSLKADAHGQAEFEFDLPDQLTGWRIMAVALTPEDRMGLGQGSISVSKPTELRALTPNQLSVGDRFNARFSLLNRSDRVRTLALDLQVQGGARAQSRQNVVLQPFERTQLGFEVTVTQAQPLAFLATAGDAQDQDALRLEVPVSVPMPASAAAVTARIDAQTPFEQRIEVPGDAEDAALILQWSATRIGTLGGALTAMRDYPYNCWEQQLSRALMAGYAHQITQQRGRAPIDWPQAATLPVTVLENAADFQAPGGGMAFFEARDAYVSPYLSAFTGLGFAWLQQLGYAPPAAVWDRLDAYLLKLLRETLPHEGLQTTASRAQLRAVALAALAARGKVSADEIERHAEQLPQMDAFGQSLLLQAAQQTPGARAVAARAQQLLWQRLEPLSAANVHVRSEGAGGWALLDSPLRANCAALSAWLTGVPAPAPVADQLSRLVHHIETSRSVGQHWGNTQENLFCTRALLDYAARFESTAVDLTLRAQLDAREVDQLRLTAQTPPAELIREQPLAAASTSILRVQAQGQGQGYLDATLRYRQGAHAPPSAAGMGLQRHYAVFRKGRWQALDAPPGGTIELAQGELLKSELIIDLPQPMNYVIVDDPVAGGIEPLNPDLATTSGVDLEALTAGSGHPWPFYHRAIRNQAVRYYADRVPRGQYRLVWVGQAIASGEFAAARAHAEQLYAPDVFANSQALRLRVNPGDRP